MLPPDLSGGPHNLGDPDDRTLRKVEREVLIPKLLREKTKVEKCSLEGEEFTNCCKETGFFMVWKCKDTTKKLQNCLERWYHDEEYNRITTEEYLQSRAEYRRTGIGQKQSRKEATMM